MSKVIGIIQPGSCGQTSVPNLVNLANPSKRIVGGVEARANSMPWIVSLRRLGNHACGGTLLRVNGKDESDIVLTAAHCMTRSDFDVVLGAHYARTRTGKGEEKVKIAQVVIHPSYNNPGKSANDVALLKLAQPIKFGLRIQPACLPAQNENAPDGTNGIVAGWGNLRETGGDRDPEALNQVVVPIVSSELCRKFYGDKLMTEFLLCAGYVQGKKDACQGDSGGPYVLEGKNGYTLHGVVSWGSGCARQRSPGVYARVSNYVDWIQSQIKTLSSVKA